MQTAVRVKLLGTFEISVRSRIVEQGNWRLKKAAALVKLLALEANHRLHREQVMDRLWPDLNPQAAANNLRRALYVARRALDPDPATNSLYLALEGEQLVLCPRGHLWVDLEAFEEAAATARRERAPAAYRAALELYTGDLLPEDRYEEWTETRREELSQIHLVLLVELAHLYEQRGEFRPAIEALRRAVTQEPTNEKAHTALIRSYVSSGQRQRSLGQYEQFRDILRRELGAEPVASVRALREEIAAGRFPPPERPLTGPPKEEASGAGKHNLPAPSTGFVGREREMVEVKRELAMTRLLTLTGAGGSGKTRLALQVAQDLVGAYPDGVWLVELAGLSEPDLLPQAVASAMGVREQPDQPLTDTLLGALRTEEILLVLDNCEHLVEGVAKLASALLDSCPRLRILSTSREVLGVAGEVRWEVPSLSVPHPWRPPAVGHLEGYESARLFAIRAAERRPSFALTPENARTVADICWRLEGMPLAIELAAARVGVLSVEQILERLEDSLKLLTAGGRTATPRHRTLRGTLDWSHKLLCEEEKQLFRRLSVFSRGCTLEAAETVCSGGGIEESQVLDLLSNLVDKSLVVAEESWESGMRYRMLEPVRQYAGEQLKEVGEADKLRRKHAALFIELAEKAKPELRGPQQRIWLGQLESEHDNLRAALGWLLERNDELGLRLGCALWPFWPMRGHLSEGRRWLEAGLASSSTAPLSVRAKALVNVGWLAQSQGDYEEARAAYEESLELYRRIEDEVGIADSLGKLGSLILSLGGHEQAKVMLEESLALLRPLEDERGVMFGVLNDLGTLADHQGDRLRALTLYEEALSLSQKKGDAYGKALALGNMGFTTLLYGNSDRATALLEESLTLFREIEDTLDIAICLVDLGLAVLVKGDNQRAVGIFQESLTLAYELGDRLGIAQCLEAMAGAAAAQGKSKRAVQLWGAAQALREELGTPLPTNEREILMPYLAAARGRLEHGARETVFEEGRAMTFEEAVEYALSIDESTPAASPVPEKALDSAQPSSLSRREEEVATLVAQGMTNRQVASELSISEGTVATHLRRIFKKLGVRSRAGLATWVSEQQPSSSNLH